MAQHLGQAVIVNLNSGPRDGRLLKTWHPESKRLGVALCWWRGNPGGDAGTWVHISKVLPVTVAAGFAWGSS